MPALPIAMLDLSGHGWAGGLVMLFALVIGHAVADFALQTEFIATAKNPNAKLERFFGAGKVPKGVWCHALAAHSLIHAGAVWLITGSVILGAIEFVLHSAIDFAKSEECTSFHTDQFLHLGCKVVYAALIGMGVCWIQWSP